MLERLNIKNIAVIDSAEVPFESGLNILSGETGAGKSIVIEAISLLLGSRANADLVRSGCDEAIVEGLFHTKEIPWIETRLAAAGFAADDGELLIKRIVSRNGKHRIYVNGALATLSTLQSICEDLVDLCGQHEHQSLLKPRTQMELLDRYGGLEKEARATGEAHAEYRRLRDERAALEASYAEKQRKADFLKFQIEELRAADLRSGEDQELQSEKLLLQSSEARLAQAEAARQAIEGDGDGSGALAALRTAHLKLKQLSALDAATAETRDRVEQALAEIEEASLALNRYLGASDMDPSRLESVQERLSRLADLRRKYGTSVDEMLARLDGMEKEFRQIENFDDVLKELAARIDAQRARAVSLASALGAKRAKVAKLLSKSVTGELKDLKMAEAQFQVDLGYVEAIDEWSQLGANSIQFLVQTNKGEALAGLGKIASGGELSRLMLAIRRVIADRGGIGVYLFDEIDAGIGGQTAFEVGKKLKSVAKFNQVICITHLPQVAAFADHHLSVQKATSGARTVTTVVELAKKERREEIARMLGGPQLTKKSLENAAELLDLAH